MEDFQRQQSVWKLLQECVSESELPEIRSVLGDALIDMYTEIYSEMQMWEQIWQDACHSGQGGRPPNPCALADPPAIKDLLKAEIQILLLNLRENATRLGRNEDEVLSQYHPRVVTYALGDSGSEKLGPVSRCDSVIPPSRSSSRLSSGSSCEEEIEALRHKLNITHIDEVVAHLRSVLTEECEVLKRDIQFLQESVELEHQKQKELVEPTLTELKEERHILWRDLNACSLMSETVCKDKPRSCPSSFSSRDTRLDNLTLSNSQCWSASSVPSRTDFPCPKPPSPEVAVYSRPHSDKPRHRHFLKAVRSSSLSMTTGRPQELSSDYCMSTNPSKEAHLLPLSSSTSSFVVCNSSSYPHKPKQDIRVGLPVRTINRQYPSTVSNHEILSASSTARDLVISTHFGLQEEMSRAESQAPLMPTPPTVQRAATRGQRTNRRLILPPAELLSPS